jgi:ABC-type transport system involved in cytochrome bd biosynthesis fused ATPase/permease subunit
VGLVRGGTAGFRPIAALAVAASLAIATAAAWQAFGAAVGYSMAALAVTVTALVLASAHQRAARIWHLQATYRGVETTVYSSADVRVFNQVTRALRRSIEDSRQVRPSYGMAPA